VPPKIVDPRITEKRNPRSANIDLASTEGELFTALGRESILREALDGSATAT